MICNICRIAADQKNILLHDYCISTLNQDTNWCDCQHKESFYATGTIEQGSKEGESTSADSGSSR